MRWTITLAVFAISAVAPGVGGCRARAVSAAAVPTTGRNAAPQVEQESMNAKSATTSSGSFGLVIHGGAGTIDPAQLTPTEEAEYRAKLRESVDAGYTVLERGGTSLDAVQASIQILEDSPLFNAGKGAVFTHEGTNEMDASVMDGSTGMAGAVAGIRTVRNPILAARAVMEHSPHVMLSGRGAEEFCREQGLPQAPPEYFETEHRRRQLEEIRDSAGVQLDHGSGAAGSDKFGTVGAVALDQHGHLAAGTSTGGMTNKRWGRIGDSPVIGAGTFADDDSCAVSATGHGEFFIREAAAHSVCARMEFGGQSLADAAHAVVFDQLDAIGGAGGLIAMSPSGEAVMPFNTSGMYRAFRLSDGRTGVAIWAEDHPREEQ
jgi:beta-aspartyl-peptidase (threonine type)